MKSFFLTGLLIALMPLLSACSQTPSAPPPDYLLPGASHSGHSPLQVRVSLASYLDQGGIVLQLSDTELHVARQHRWAEPLGAQLQRALAATLAGQTTLPEQGKLDLQLSRFQGVQSAQGDIAMITGTWQFRAEEQTRQGNIDWQGPINGEGYAALVEALDQGWQETAQTITQALK
ncbi:MULTISPECIES: ABC-type transport auxiliary lipoprotein family protein [Alcanivorax]|uniref:PqiC family protein n=1 Tax=Alcanivorax TaxID=59753 RepID=UPI0025B885A6|nr:MULTISPECIES: ABC-type transport auxiliary lipoprotein family protein [Alcanivorax]